MRVYRFDRVTGIYAGALDLDDSDRDPRDPTRYLIPGDATAIAPPDIPAGHVAQFDGAGWAIVMAPPQAVDPAISARLIAQGLSICDRVALSCFKWGLAYPADWRAYEAQLVAIAMNHGHPLAPLPEMPAMPAVPVM